MTEQDITQIDYKLLTSQTGIKNAEAQIDEAETEIDEADERIEKAETKIKEAEAQIDEIYDKIKILKLKYPENFSERSEFKYLQMDKTMNEKNQSQLREMQSKLREIQSQLLERQSKLRENQSLQEQFQLREEQFRLSEEQFRLSEEQFRMGNKRGWTGLNILTETIVRPILLSETQTKYTGKTNNIATTWRLTLDNEYIEPWTNFEKEVENLIKGDNKIVSDLLSTIFTTPTINNLDYDCESHADFIYSIVELLNDVFLNKLFYGKFKCKLDARPDPNITSSCDIMVVNVIENNKFIFEIKIPSNIAQSSYENMAKSFKDSKDNSKLSVEQLYSYMVYGKTTFGALSTRNKTWFLKINQTGHGLMPKLMISNAIETKDLLKSLFYVFFEFPKEPKTYEMFQTVRDASVADSGSAIATDSESSKQSNAFHLQAYKKCIESGGNKFQEIYHNHICKIRAIEPFSKYRSSPAWWTPIENSYFHFMWLAFPQVNEPIDNGLTGCVVKTNLEVFNMPHTKSVMVKSYDVYSDYYLENYRSQKVCDHIKNEIRIYKHLNQSPWPSHVPVLHFIGTFISYRGLIIEYVEDREVKFSQMTDEQASSCQNALKQLHDRGVLHNDIHWRNFIIDRENKAFIIDFGLSTICDPKVDKAMFEKEAKFLKWKIENKNNTVKQSVE